MPEHDKKVLLFVTDGPEAIEIYTSMDEAIVADANDVPGLYITVHCSMNSFVKLGPFGLSKNLIAQLRDRLVMTVNERLVFQHAIEKDVIRRSAEYDAKSAGQEIGLLRHLVRAMVDDHTIIVQQRAKEYLANLEKL